VLSRNLPINVRTAAIVTDSTQIAKRAFLAPLTVFAPRRMVALDDLSERAMASVTWDTTEAVSAVSHRGAH
jgi:hypothetical protein